MKVQLYIVALALSYVIMFFGCSGHDRNTNNTSADYDDLIELFQEFREFQQPVVINGVPDYTHEAMQKRARELKDFQERLAGLEIDDWPVSRQVDYHMVRAEMNALDFYHRVLKPWARFPAFYLYTRTGSRQTIYTTQRFPDFPVSSDNLDEFRKNLKTIPSIFEQAEHNLTEGVGDLVPSALRWIEDESALYNNIVAQVREYHPELLADAEQARASLLAYRDWLIENKNKMTSPAGIGIDNFNWWMKNVLLFPYSWEELRTLADREYDRAYTALKLTENKNRNLPPLIMVTTEADYIRQWKKMEDHTLTFAEEDEIFTFPEYLKPDGMGAWWNAPDGIGEQDFFKKCSDSNPLSEISHGLLGHTFYWLRHERDEHPIRGAYPSFGVEMIIDEGLAFAWEELMVYAGMYKEYPRGEEITYNAQVFRAVRMITDLKIHSNEFTPEEAAHYYAEKTPYGWVSSVTENTVHDIEMGVDFPGYAMGYVGGKFQIEKLLADRAHQLGDTFVLRDFMDEFFAAGTIPFALLRWELTGFDDEVKKLW